MTGPSDPTTPSDPATRFGGGGAASPAGHVRTSRSRRRRAVLPAATVALGVLGAGCLVAAGLSAAAADPAGTAASPAAVSTPTTASEPATSSGAASGTAAAGTGSATTGSSTAGSSTTGSSTTGSSTTASGGTAITTLVDPTWLAEVAQASDIPERALAAYAGAALATAVTHPSCGLGWNTVAAIGLVESGHGTLQGGQIEADGRAVPTIVGVPLDGDGVATVPDTDQGALDGDVTWDRAVGPLQFVPATWAAHATDGNADGVLDVNQIDDAALSAAVYLCEVGGDLTTEEGWIAAVAAYNPAADYNNEVAQAADRYAAVNR